MDVKHIDLKKMIGEQYESTKDKEITVTFDEVLKAMSVCIYALIEENHARILIKDDMALFSALILHTLFKEEK